MMKEKDVIQDYMKNVIDLARVLRNHQGRTQYGSAPVNGVGREQNLVKTWKDRIGRMKAFYLFSLDRT